MLDSVPATTNYLVNQRDTTDLVVTPTTGVRLPANYEEAQRAIEKCFRVDECKDWADKMEALASYARQAKNDNLRLMAVRIQMRAERRLGQLLKQFPAASGARTDLGPVPTRGSMAREAGLSERQRKNALRIASVPAADFHRQVESDCPPTATQLAEQGKGLRPERHPSDAERLAGEARDALMTFARFCESHDALQLARLFASHEILVVRRYVATVDLWLDQFVTNLR